MQLRRKLQPPWLLKICYLFFAVTSVSFSQISQFEGKPVVDIQYSPPSTLAPQDLARAQPLKIGEPLTTAEVASAIDGLFATGRFVDIRVEAESSATV